MTTSRRLATLPLLLIGLAALCAALALIPWVAQAQSQEVTATAAATGENPPAKPTSLQASAVHDSVTVTWTVSTDQTVTHYAILRRNPDTDASQVFHVIESNAGPETSYADGTVSASTTYIYRVKAVSPTGVSQWSGYVKAETPAAPDSTLEPTPTPTPTPSPEPVSTPTPEDLRPTGLTVSLVGNKVTLSWTAPAEDAESVDGYEILRRRPMEGESALATLVADTESTATTYTDATANEAGVRYVYRVKALRGDDVSLSSNFDRIDLPVDYVPDPTPAPEPESTTDDQAPTGLSAALAEGGGVALTWTAPSEDADSVTGYEVLRAVGEGDMTTLASDTASTTTSYTDATATEAGKTYAYQVKAIRGQDRSQASAQAEVQLPHDPGDLAPTGLTAVGLTASLVVVGEDSTTTTSTFVRLSWSAPAEDASSVTGYEVLRAVGGGEIATLVADTGSTATAYTDTTATEAGETYAYKVKAIRGEDRSQASGQARVQLPHATVDLAPSDLTAEAVDGGGVDLSWSAPAEDAGGVTGYEVLRAVGEGEMATLVDDTASTGTAYTDATATQSGTSYTYKVKAIRGEDRSQASAAASAALPTATVSTCEFDAGGSDLPADTSTACALAVGGSVRGEAGTASDVDWYRVGLQADATYQFDMRGKSTGEWQLVDGAPTFVSVGTLEDPKLLGIYDASGALVPATDSESAGTGKDSRIASFSPDADGVYYISASAESGWTGTYELSLAVTAGEHVVVLILLAPSGLEVSMALNQVTLSWTAPAADADSVTGYEILRTVGEGEMSTLVDDTGTTATSYTDATATTGGETYAYQVKAIRGEDRSRTSGQAKIRIPHDPADLAPTGLTASTMSVVALEEKSASVMVSLSWTAPAEEAESVTGYEILRAVGEGEFATLADDTGSTATFYFDTTATTAGETYAYQVKAIRGEDRSQASGQAQVLLDSETPDGESVVKVEDVAGESDSDQAVVKFDDDKYAFAQSSVVAPEGTFFAGSLTVGFGNRYSQGQVGSLAPDRFGYGVDIFEFWHIIAFPDTTNLFIMVVGTRPNGTQYIPSASATSTWTFVTPDGSFAFADADLVQAGNLIGYFWANTGLDWTDRRLKPFTVFLTQPGGVLVNVLSAPIDVQLGVKLTWKSTILTSAANLPSIPTKVGFEIFRSERTLWGNFAGSNSPIGEVVRCDNDQEDGARSCLAVSGGSGTEESWSWTDTTAERGVSYSYVIRPYQEFYSNDGSTIANVDAFDVRDEIETEPPHRVRTHGNNYGFTPIRHRIPHPDEPGAATNLRASQPNSGTCTGACVRLEWDAAPNATKYVIFRVGARGDGDPFYDNVDNGTTYPQQRFYPADPDLTVTEWEDTSAEAGVVYSYRVSAFNDDNLRSPDDIIVTITTEGPSMPNRVRNFSAEATIKSRVKNTGQTVAGNQSLNTTTRERFAQRFKTGGSTGEVRLGSVAVKFGEIQNVSTAADVLEATVNTVSGSVPGSTVVCTLTDPVTYVSEGVNTYHGSSCDLDANTAYFFVLKRTGGTATIELAYTTSLSEDLGSSDWRIADSRYRYDSAGSGTWSSANQVHLIEVIHAPSEAEVTLSWAAPQGGATPTAYQIEYRLDIPERGEWGDDWKVLTTSVASSARSHTDTIALEAWYAQGGTTPPVEYVPTRDKSTLNLNDTDTGNDLILPFGITYEYRIRAVNGSNKGLPATDSVRVPNQSGVPDVVILHVVTGDPLDVRRAKPYRKPGFLDLSGWTNACVQWEPTIDDSGDTPDGYRILIASVGRRFSEREVVVHYLSYSDAASGSCLTQEPQRAGLHAYRFNSHFNNTGPYYWIAVQAYDSDGIGKGDGSGGPRITRPEIALYEDRKQTQSDGEEFIDVQDGESEAKLEEDSE